MTQTIILPTREMNWKTVRTDDEDDEKRRIERKERDKCGKNEERERFLKSSFFFNEAKL